ncbi:MAG TPA: dihydrofolate reductase family protein [Solirubrobacteraceae bacterium]|nr:dihydrofolate reductase family protein [Solirubrobacteraceae bacterium]
MRKIVSGLFITLDGVVEAPERWNPPFYGPEMNEDVQAQLAASDTHLYGRRSYELFRSAFTGPARERIGHAELMNTTPKIVVSTTIDEADWGPTTVIRDHVAARLAELKQQPGANINVGASPTLVRFLLQEGLLDELNLHLHPLVLGEGKRLFDGFAAKVPLHLLESKRHSTGVLALRYTPAPTEGA